MWLRVRWDLSRQVPSIGLVHTITQEAAAMQKWCCLMQACCAMSPEAWCAFPLEPDLKSYWLLNRFLGLLSGPLIHNSLSLDHQLIHTFLSIHTSHLVLNTVSPSPPHPHSDDSGTGERESKGNWGEGWKRNRLRITHRVLNRRLLLTFLLCRSTAGRLFRLETRPTVSPQWGYNWQSSYRVRQMAIFLQRYVQATVLPLERKGSLIEMQPVIFTIQKTHWIILSSEKNGQQFSHGG